MLRFYTALRLRQFWRFFSYHQINPFVGITILCGIFLFISALIFERLSYAPAIYSAIAFLSLVQFQSAGGNEFLLQHLGRQRFFQAKLIENILFLLPFLFVLWRCHQHAYAGVLLLLVLPYSWFSFPIPRPAVAALPAPYPPARLEYRSGFRTWFIAYIIHLVLLPAGILADNIHVYLVPFFILLFCMNSFYGIVEDSSMVWQHRRSSGGFLAGHFSGALRAYLLTFSAFFIIGFFFFSAHAFILSLCLIAGFCSLVGSMLIKYHFYPSGFIIQISQVVWFGLVIWALISPPLLLLLFAFMAFSYFRAKNNLKDILQC